MSFMDNVKNMFAGPGAVQKKAEEGLRKFEVIKVTTRTRQKGVQNTGSILRNKTAQGAVRKAANRICRSSKIRGRCALNISLREVLPGGEFGEEFHYHVVRTKKQVPVERVLPDGTTVSYVYETVVRKATEEDLMEKPTKQQLMKAPSAPKVSAPIQLSPEHQMLFAKIMENFQGMKPTKPTPKPKAHKVKPQSFSFQVNQANVPLPPIMVQKQQQQVKQKM